MEDSTTRRTRSSTGRNNCLRSRCARVLGRRMSSPVSGTLTRRATGRMPSKASEDDYPLEFRLEWLDVAILFCSRQTAEACLLCGFSRRQGISRCRQGRPWPRKDEDTLAPSLVLDLLLLDSNGYRPLERHHAQSNVAQDCYCDKQPTVRARSRSMLVHA